MNCNRCGACCIAPSISTVIPGTGKGKKAGERCVHLSEDMICSIYEKRPLVCREFTPTIVLCGSGFDDAFPNLSELEKLTSPK